MHDDAGCDLRALFAELSAEVARRRLRAVEGWLESLKDAGLLPTPSTHGLAHWPDERADNGSVSRLALVPDNTQAADWEAIDDRMKLEVIMMIEDSRCSIVTRGGVGRR